MLQNCQKVSIKLEIILGQNPQTFMIPIQYSTSVLYYDIGGERQILDVNLRKWSLASLSYGKFHQDEFESN